MLKKMGSGLRFVAAGGKERVFVGDVVEGRGKSAELYREVWEE